MTQLSERPTTETERPRARVRRPAWQIALVAPFAGLLIGIVARWWMRLVTDEPEFSWSGTIFIVGAFTITGMGHGLAWAARRADLRRRWTTPARVLATVLTLPIFVGAGVMMMPTVLCASLAHHRRDWRRAVRVIVFLLALPAPIVIVVDIVRNGITPGRLLGVVLFVATYVIVVRSLGAVVAPIDDGWRMGRRVRIAIVVGTSLLVLFAVTSVVGVATAAG